jgi:hypothetical protein
MAWDGPVGGRGGHWATVIVQRRRGAGAIRRCTELTQMGGVKQGISRECGSVADALVSAPHQAGYALPASRGWVVSRCMASPGQRINRSGWKPLAR